MDADLPVAGVATSQLEFDVVVKMSPLEVSMRAVFDGAGVPPITCENDNEAGDAVIVVVGVKSDETVSVTGTVRVEDPMVITTEP